MSRNRDWKKKITCFVWKLAKILIYCAKLAVFCVDSVGGSYEIIAQLQNNTVTLGSVDEYVLKAFKHIYSAKSIMILINSSQVLKSIIYNKVNVYRINFPVTRPHKCI